MSKQDIAADSPVTIDVSRRIKPGCEAAFEEVLLGTIAAAMSFEGHLGVNVFRPTTINSEYRVIFKFDHLSNLRCWEKSEIRHEWLAQMEGLTLGLVKVQVLTGLETWFTLPGQHTITPPPRYKMAIITWLAVFFMIVGINLLFGAFLNSLPMLLRSFILTVTLVSLMTYVVMPRMTQLFTGWLYPVRQNDCREKRKAERYRKS
jgi:uncharacterized protein